MVAQDRLWVNVSAPDPPVEARDLDLGLAATLAGAAVNDDVLARLQDAGFAGLRLSHGYFFQHLVAGPQPVGTLAERLAVTQQAVSKTAGELERLGYVERTRDPGDARVRRVGLTTRGRAAVEAARAARSEVDAELRARLGSARVEAAAELLRDVLAERGRMPDIARRRVRPPG